MVPEWGSVYHIAMADFLKAPEFDEIDVSRYVGNPGNITTLDTTL